MKRSGIAGPLLLLLIVLTGCSGAADTDASYVAEVRKGIPALEEVPEADLTELGKNFCEAFKRDGVDEGLDTAIESGNRNGLSLSDVSTLVRAAIPAYCPEFSDRIG